jgi:hypothetical protein
MGRRLRFGRDFGSGEDAAWLRLRGTDEGVRRYTSRCGTDEGIRRYTSTGDRLHLCV